MFDDLEKNDQNTNSPIPKAKVDLGNNIDDQNHLFDKNTSINDEKVDDIFSDTDNSSKPATLQSKNPENIAIDNSIDDNSNIKKVITFGSMVVILVVIIIGGYILLNKVFTKTTVSTDENIQNEVDEKQSEENEDNVIDEKKEVVREEAIEDNVNKDTDQDGLTDIEEEELGLNINKADSDEDGLFDREEVKIYRTDPLNKDSDGDGYEDGAEVKGGYNPNGDGKLFELP